MKSRVLIWGASGRMGRAIAAEVAGADDLKLVGAVSREQAPTEDAVDVVVDFSTPGAARAALAWALDRRVAFVTGTTGLPTEMLGALDEASATIPVLQAANMSLGVAVTRAIVRRAAAALPLSFQPEIVELHHRHKIDAPSGTALALMSDIAREREGSRAVHGRSGAVGERSSSELGVHAVRGGDVVGEHTVYFLGEGERIEVTHRATDRGIFARGAVAAARWIAGQRAGRYSMDDVLGLS